MLMCRSCGDFDQRVQPKFIPFFGTGKHQNLMETIKNVLGNSENDGLPQHLCPSCFSKFDAYISLRTFCRKIQNTLNTLFRKMTSDQTEKCLVYKENYENNEKNEEITTKEDTNRSLFCYKKKEVDKALDVPNNDDINVNDFMLNSIEFVAMPTKLSKMEQKAEEDRVVKKGMQWHNLNMKRK